MLKKICDVMAAFSFLAAIYIMLDDFQVSAFNFTLLGFCFALLGGVLKNGETS